MRHDFRSCRVNRPLPSSKNPHFQNEVKCTTFLVKMSFVCMRMKNHFHIKGWALNLVLIQRPEGTRKWPIRPTTFVRQIVDVLSENCVRVDGRKSWRMLVAHDSRKQKSYRLNLPLKRVDITHEKHWKTYPSLSFLITEQTFSLASVFHINSGFSWLAAQRTNYFLRIKKKKKKKS